jgi:DNA ligase-1
MKRAFQGNLADSVDVVILGYYFGRGKKVNFGMGALLGGVYDREKDEFVSIAKIGTGITDEQWRTFKKDLDQVKQDQMDKRINIDKKLIPDQWVYPEIVVTVEADEITKSPVHTCARDKDGVGLALRFPRLKVWKRDKDAEDCTSVEEVVDMFESSKANKSRSKAK